MISKFSALLAAMILFSSFTALVKAEEQIKKNDAIRAIKAADTDNNAKDEKPSEEAKEGWYKNLDEALAAAKKENKLVFLDVTGSDWCGWCKEFIKNISTKEEFLSEVKKNFILCEIDYRTQSKMTEDETKQHEAVKEKYNIKGYPTFMALNAEGKPVAKFGMSYKNGVDGCLKIVNEGFENSKKVCAADITLANEKSSTDEKIAATKTLLENTSGIMSFYIESIEKNLDLDKDNKQGLRAAHCFAQIGNIGFPNPKNIESFDELLGNYKKLENLGETDKTRIEILDALRSAMIDKKYEEAIKVLEAKKGTDFNFGGNKMDFDYVIGWMQKQIQK